MLFLSWGMWAIACLIGWMMDSFMLALGVGAALAAWINREPGRLTLGQEGHQSTTPFARTFSSTLGTMRGTLNQVSEGVSTLLEESDSILQRNAALLQRTDEQANALAVAATAMEQPISTSVARTHSGTEQVAEAGKTMQEIIQTINGLNNLVQEPADMNDQQLTSIT